jgi:hypothetical protein
MFDREEVLGRIGGMAEGTYFATAMAMASVCRTTTSWPTFTSSRPCVSAGTWSVRELP